MLGVISRVATRCLRQLAVCLALGVAAIGQAGAVDLRQGLLWEVKRSGVPVSYVYGTIHSDDPRALALLDAALPYMDTCTTMTTEVILDAQSARQSAHVMTLGDGRTLRETLGDALFGKVVALLQPRGLPEQQLDRLKPWAVMTILAYPESKSGKVVDSMLAEWAAQEGKPVRALESVAEQLDALDGLSETDQIELLRSTVEGADQLPKLMDDLLDAYAAQDLSALERLSMAQVGSVTELVEARFLDRLLYTRNRRMVERMKSVLEKGGACVAVGALHLSGDAGVLRKLSQQGYQLVPRLLTTSRPTSRAAPPAASTHKSPGNTLAGP